ncbi:MAG: crosslink repair DNA glycosylase YcaQ family protein [Bacillota bacterium]|nr:crosslink repair DNA glycosylase YcaQ family protein [Bacillota bacterium]
MALREEVTGTESAREITLPKLNAARVALCYLDDSRPPLEDSDAAELVRQRGFMLLGVMPRLGLPSLSGADEEREWNVSWRAWRWKEVLPAARSCAYLKWFRGQGTFISWGEYPSFYALWGPRGDQSDSYRAGLLSRPELEVLDVIAEHGPISSRELWFRLRSRLARRSDLLAALAVLQKRFFVTVAGGDLKGWSMHHWDLAARCAPPGLLDKLPSPAEAQSRLVTVAVRNLVCCRPRDVAGLFGWAPSDVAEVAGDLVRQGVLRADMRIAGQPGPHFSHTLLGQANTYCKPRA